jgi:hypothetical protein
MHPHFLLLEAIRKLPQKSMDFHRRRQILTITVRDLHTLAGNIIARPDIQDPTQLSHPVF